MGLLDQLKSLRKKRGEGKILVLGLDNAGKTTILRMLSQQDLDTVEPTRGFNVKTLNSNGFKLNMWDIGGQAALRQYWQNYYKDNDAIILVIDSADNLRFDELREVLQEILAEAKLNGIPMLFLANKQDLETSMEANEIMTELALDQISGRAWTIQACSAMNGEGVNEGLEWLIETLNTAQAGGAEAGAAAQQEEVKQ